MRKIEEIHIHHFAQDYDDWLPGETSDEIKKRTAKRHKKTRQENMNAAQRIVNSVRHFHKNIRGWFDIAYHDIIFSNGVAVSGRHIRYDPASIIGRNKGAIAICFGGNYDKRKPSGIQLKKTSEICYDYMAKHNLSIKNIKFHREYSGKTCPGKLIDKDEFLKCVRATNER